VLLLTVKVDIVEIDLLAIIKIYEFVCFKTKNRATWNQSVKYSLFY